MLFFYFVITFVSCACVLVPLVCLGIGVLSRQGRKSARNHGVDAN